MQPSHTGPFSYTPDTKRPRLRWPNDNRLAVWVIPNVETFPLDMKIPNGAGVVPDVNNWAKREYGNRVGIFRMMKTLSRFGIRGTMALNSQICDTAPDIVEEALKLDWEIIGHGQTNSIRLGDVKSRDEEEEIIQGTVEQIQAFSGVKIRGWLGPALQETWNSLDLLADAGIEYVGDWTTDDQPYWLSVGERKMLSIPYGHDMGDMNAIMRGHYSPAEFTQMMIDSFNVLYRESFRTGKVLPVSLHPFLTGVPHRIDGLARGLEYFTRYEDVWFATGSEIRDHYVQSDAQI